MVNKIMTDMIERVGGKWTATKEAHEEASDIYYALRDALKEYWDGGISIPEKSEVFDERGYWKFRVPTSHFQIIGYQVV